MVRRVASSMSSESTAAESTLRERIESFMMRNFPQISMHGGSFGIHGVDEETGEVWVSLGGACSGCGISPMTIQAVKTRLVAEFDDVTEVHVDAGVGTLGGGGDPDVSDAPF